MNCDEPVYREGEKFPRLEVAEPDPTIARLIDAAARKQGRWDLDEVQWPIVVEVTTVYVVNAPGATEDEALANYGDDYPDLEGEHAIDGSFEVRRPDEYQRSMTAHTSPFGPFIRCPGCGELAMRREWYHNPLRKCHGPIQWRETPAPSLRYRYSREVGAAPVYDVGQAVAS